MLFAGGSVDCRDPELRVGWGPAERLSCARSLHLRVRVTRLRTPAFLRSAMLVGSFLLLGFSRCLAGVVESSPPIFDPLSVSSEERSGRETHVSLSTPRIKVKCANPCLEKVKQLRQLSSAQAERLIPVKLTGVVTDLSGYKNSFFFQDETGGISVDRTDSADVHAGDRVEIIGTSGPGLFAPVVLASRVIVTGQSPPPATHRFMYGDLFGGAQDSQWVEIEGIVHFARIEEVDEHTVLHLRLEIGGGPVNVMLQDFTEVDIAHLVDA